MKTLLTKMNILLLSILILSGCSSNSFNDLFSSYTQQMRGVKLAQNQGHFQQGISLLPKRSTNDGSYNLGLLEKARLEYLAKNNEQSRKDFAYVYQLIEQSQQKAKVELSRGFENVAAIVSNDNAVRYDIPLYEQSMLHSYQALNYLTQQNLSGALVEVRRANQVQEKALLANIDNINKSIDNLPQQYPSMNRTIGDVKNGFQNAYTFYLSAVLYESAGQKNDAYIDFKKALEIYPDSTYLQQNVWRLANILRMTDDITLFKSTLSRAVTKKAKQTQNNGKVIFIVENGIVEAKQETSLSLPIYTSHSDARFYNVALPSYANHLTVYSPLTLAYQGQQYQSQEVVRLQSLAAKQLQDMLPIIIARQITRLVAKEEIRQTLARKGGDIGNIFANIYNIVSEKADTRSWNTLPDSIQILELNLTVGNHLLNVDINGVNQQIAVSINKNRQTLVTLSSIGTYTDYSVFNL